MGVGGRGKCPGAPSHHLKEGEDRQKKELESKNRRPKRYRKKSRMAKNGNGIKKKLTKKREIVWGKFLEKCMLNSLRVGITD
jgi:hypothetical protein